jgi:hypothetical protein
MTKPKSHPKAAARSAARKAATSASRKRLVSTPAKPKAVAKTKQARAIAMLQAPTGATITALMTATDWQSHSVRGFLAGVVRKKLRFNLVSEQTDKGRVYRIKDGKPSSGTADQTKQPA